MKMMMMMRILKMTKVVMVRVRNEGRLKLEEGPVRVPFFVCDDVS